MEHIQAKQTRVRKEFTVNIEYWIQERPKRSPYKTQVRVNTILFILGAIRLRISANRRNSCTLWRPLCARAFFHTHTHTHTYIRRLNTYHEKREQISASFRGNN